MQFWKRLFVDWSQAPIGCRINQGTAPWPVIDCSTVASQSRCRLDRDSTLARNRLPALIGSQSRAIRCKGSLLKCPAMAPFSRSVAPPGSGALAADAQHGGVHPPGHARHLPSGVASDQAARHLQHHRRHAVRSRGRLFPSREFPQPLLFKRQLEIIFLT